jgi:hypothetical protein
MTTIDFTTVFDSPELAALGKGRLSLTIVAKNAPHNVISGLLVPKFSCDLFDSVLSPLPMQDEDLEQNLTNQVTAATVLSDARGLAWMYMDRNGLIKYHLRLNDLSGPLQSIQIDNGRKSRRLLRIVHEMDFVGDQREGWANGTFRMEASDVDDMYHANLYINVATEDNERELRGRIIQHLITPAQELAKFPLLLSGNPPNRTMISGLAWVNVDSTCRFHYQIRLNGVDKSIKSKLTLKDHPMRNLKALNLVPGRQIDLQDFSGPEATGHQDAIHKLTMARLDSGDASLTVVSHMSPGHELRFQIESRIIDVQAPQDCKPRFSRNDLEMMPGFLNDLGEEKPEADKEYALKCFYETTIYEDGSQWKASHEACQMCSCQRLVSVIDHVYKQSVIQYSDTVKCLSM